MVVTVPAGGLGWGRAGAGPLRHRGRLAAPQAAFPAASERQYQHGSCPSGQPSGLVYHAAPKP